MPSEGIRGSITEHKVVASLAAGAVVLGLGAAGLNACTGNDDPSKKEFNGVNQEQIDGYCNVEPFTPREYKDAIGENAATPLESLAGNDLNKIREEAAKEIAKNNFGLAWAKVLMDYNSQPVDFADIKQRAETLFSLISSDDDERERVCGEVVSAFITEGDRVEITSSGYSEPSPIYDGNAINTNKSELLDVAPNGVSVSGFWRKTEQGQLPVNWTADGRFLISKTLGNENGDTSFDPNAEPQTFIDQNGNEVTVTPKPDGTVEFKTKNPQTGEVSTVVAPGPNQGNNNTGGSAGPNGTNPEAGPGGVTKSPATGDTVPGTVVTSAPPNTTLPPMTITIPTTTQPRQTTTTQPATTTTQPRQTTTTQPATTTSVPYKPPKDCDPNIDANC